jgi:hypothetical protein
MVQVIVVERVLDHLNGQLYLEDDKHLSATEPEIAPIIVSPNKEPFQNINKNIGLM